jgi:hypothetical protein
MSTRPERAYEIAARAAAPPGAGGASLNLEIEVREVMSAPPRDPLGEAEHQGVGGAVRAAWIAPENAPLRNPNSSVSARVSGSAPQLTATKLPVRPAIAWTARATSSLPGRSRPRSGSRRRCGRRRRGRRSRRPGRAGRSRGRRAARGRWTGRSRGGSARRPGARSGTGRTCGRAGARRRRTGRPAGGAFR